jgi:Zn finger protein HypA/HybF involved in hydrogenase expression
MKNIETFEKFKNKKEKECKFCYKNFTPTEKDQTCCCPECDSKYNKYLTQDNSEKPWNKFTK